MPGAAEPERPGAAEVERLPQKRAPGRACVQRRQGSACTQRRVPEGAVGRAMRHNRKVMARPADTDLAGQPDPRLADAVDVARRAAEQEGGSDAVGEHVEVEAEQGCAVTHLFDANYPGYRGWRWAVT